MPKRKTMNNNCPACEKLLKQINKKDLRKCKLCNHYFHKSEKSCVLDHDLLKNGIRGKR